MCRVIFLPVLPSIQKYAPDNLSQRRYLFRYFDGWTEVLVYNAERRISDEVVSRKLSACKERKEIDIYLFAMERDKCPIPPPTSTMVPWLGNTLQSYPALIIIRPGTKHEGNIARALEYQFRRLSSSSTLHRNGKSAEIVTILRRLEPPEHRFIGRKAKVEWNCPVIFQQRVCEVYSTFASDIRPDGD